MLLGIVFYLHRVSCIKIAFDPGRKNSSKIRFLFSLINNYDDTFTMDAQSRKRKKKQTNTDREKLKQFGVDLPEIPGVPVQIVPLYINAIKVATKFFQKDAYDDPIAPYDVGMGESNSSSSVENDSSNDFKSNTSILDSVFNQIDTAIKNSNESTNATKEMQERRKNKYNSIQSWLDATRRHVKDNSTSTTVNSSSNIEQNNSTVKGPVVSVTIALMDHIFETIFEHNRIAVRRAATHALGHLLEKSSDCRKAIYGSDTTIIESRCKYSLLDWTDATFAAHRSFAEGNENDDKAVLLLQCETYSILLHMEESGYGRLYPTIAVAIHRFVQFCPDAVVQERSSISAIRRSDMERRTIRDIAIEYYQKENEHVTKLIKKALLCIDQLVPRIGAEPAIPALVNYVASDDDDIGDIDWEDGDDADNNPEDNQQQQQHTIDSHKDAVEHTLAVMEFASGLRDGVLEIDFKKSAVNNGIDTNVDPKIKNRLIKIFKLLSERHMPRLSTWVDSLSKADRLVQATSNDVTTLVSMNTEQWHLRNEAFRTLSALKGDVAMLLQSISKLNFDTTTKPSSASVGESTDHHIAPTNLRLQQQPNKQLYNPNINSRQSKNRPTNRIQIKLKCKV